MAELAMWSICKMIMTHVDWLSSCAISFPYRLASFGGKISELISRQTRLSSVLQKICNDTLAKN